MINIFICYLDNHNIKKIPCIKIEKQNDNENIRTELERIKNENEQLKKEIEELKNIKETKDSKGDNKEDRKEDHKTILGRRGTNRIY